MNWTYKKIVNFYSESREDPNPLSEDTVSKAIRSIAEQIHLTLRPHTKGGRPKKEEYYASP
jgi:hypothetical protein